MAAWPLTCCSNPPVSTRSLSWFVAPQAVFGSIRSSTPVRVDPSSSDGFRPRLVQVARNNFMVNLQFPHEHQLFLDSNSHLVRVPRQSSSFVVCGLFTPLPQSVQPPHCQPSQLDVATVLGWLEISAMWASFKLYSNINKSKAGPASC